MKNNLIDKLNKPDSYIASCFSKILPRTRFAFCVSVIIGIITHFYIITNNLINFDTLINSYSDVSTLALGRWFSVVACFPSSNYALPWVNGMLSILYISIASTLVISTLNIRNKTSIVVICGLLVSFPAIAGAFIYLFCADGHMMSLMLACLAVYWMKKYNSVKVLCGGVFLCLSIAIYQAYASFAFMLVLTILSLDIVEYNSFKEFMRSSFKYVYTIIFGFLLYFLFLFIFLELFNVSLDGYLGLDNTSSGIFIYFKNIYFAVIECVKQIYVFFTTKAIVSNVFIKIVMIVYFVVLFAAIAIITLKWSAWKKAAILFIICCMPFVLSYIYFISYKTTHYLLMYQSWCVLFILLPIFCEKHFKTKKISDIVIHWSSAVLCFILIMNFLLVSNIIYNFMHKNYEVTYGLCVRVLDRIEQLPEYNLGVPVIFIGQAPENLALSQEIDGQYLNHYEYTDSSSVNMAQIAYRDRHYKQFIRIYLGINLFTNDMEAEELTKELKENPEFINMGKWPDRSCIKMIDGIVVVKLNDR